MRITGPVPNHILEKMPKEDRPKGLTGMTNAEAAEKQELKNERELQSLIANWLRQGDIVFNQSRMDRRKTDKVGWPDFTFAINGRALAIECKTKSGKLSEKQERVINAMRCNGWEVLIATAPDDVFHFVRSFRQV